MNAVHYSLLFRETKLFKEFKETVWNYEEWAMRWAGFLNAVFTTHSFKMCVKPVLISRVHCYTDITVLWILPCYGWSCFVGLS